MNNKVKKIIGFGLMLIVLFIISYIFNDSVNIFEELVEELIFLGIASAALLTIPIVFRLINKKQLEYKKGRKICFFNSLVIFIISSIPNLIVIINNTKDLNSSFDQVQFAKTLIVTFLIISIIYYYINMCFFVDDKNN